MTKTNKGDYSGYNDPDEIKEIKEEEKKVQDLIGKGKRFFRLDFPNDKQSKEISAAMSSARKIFTKDYVHKVLKEFDENLMNTLSQKAATHTEDLGNGLFTPQVCTVIGYCSNNRTTKYSLRDLAVIMKDPAKVDIITGLIKSKKYTNLFKNIASYIQSMNVTKTESNAYDDDSFANEQPVKFKLGKTIKIFSFADNKILKGTIKEIEIVNGMRVTFVVDGRSQALSEYVMNRGKKLSFSVTMGQEYPTSNSDILQILFQLKDDLLQRIDEYVNYQRDRIKHNKKVYKQFRNDYIAELAASVL